MSLTSCQNDFANLRLDGISKLENLAKLVHFLSEKPRVVLTRYEVYVTITQEGEDMVVGLPQYNSYIIKEGEPEVILENKLTTSGCQTGEENMCCDTQTQFISPDTRCNGRTISNKKLDTLNKNKTYYEVDRSRSLLHKIFSEPLNGATYAVYNYDQTRPLIDNPDSESIKEANANINIHKSTHTACDADISDDYLSNAEAHVSDCTESLLQTVLKSGVKSDLVVHVEKSDSELFSTKTEPLEEEERPFKCMKCNVSFQKEESLIVHGLIHTFNVEKPSFFKCPRCNFKCQSTTMIQGHAQEMHKLRVHLCLWCKFVALSSNQLAEHKSQTSHQNIVRNEIVESLPFKCSSCDFVSANTAALKKHKVVHSENRELKCSHCSTQFVRTSDLLAHIGRHGPVREKPFKCSHCSYGTYSNYFLHKHVTAAHAGRYTCKDCSRRFRNMRDLKQHAETEHGNRHSYFCPICIFSCSDRMEHKYHLQTHYGRDKLSCFHCDFTCNTKNALQRHQIIHSDKLPYGCCICGRHFREKGNLTKHLVTHGTERNHQCETCGFRTKSKRLLKDHQKVHQTLRENMCQHCGYSTKYKGNLYKHMLTHSDIKPFSCNLCPYTSKNTENLNRHKKRKHKLFK